MNANFSMLTIEFKSKLQHTLSLGILHSKVDTLHCYRDIHKPISSNSEQALGNSGEKNTQHAPNDNADQHRCKADSVCQFTILFHPSWHVIVSELKRVKRE